ncbi:hypothetical protein NWQ33_03265 [Mycoplasmopsis cynos]|nr:hypothetical protein [Mycoplasmopsis cynos]
MNINTSFTDISLLRTFLTNENNFPLTKNELNFLSSKTNSLSINSIKEFLNTFFSSVLSSNFFILL